MQADGQAKFRGGNDELSGCRRGAASADEAAGARTCFAERMMRRPSHMHVGTPADTAARSLAWDGARGRPTSRP